LIWKVILLALVQGMAELLPVSSSAHVIVAEKLLGLDPSSPQMTLLLVMLHTGTMFAVIVYFWEQWRRTFFADVAAFKRFVVLVIVATVATGVIGEGLIKLIEHMLFRHQQKAEVEMLFSHLELIAPALFAVGILILIAGWRDRAGTSGGSEVSTKASLWIGAVQGLALPFRGFSRSGATISTGMLAGVERRRAEAFSFALAVVITPPAIAREVWRLVKDHSLTRDAVTASLGSGLLGMFCAFLAGLLALKWLSRWLETGRWYLFGIYCIVASIAVFVLWRAGF
jgi:undecaprenyl-diphosphatase